MADERRGRRRDAPPAVPPIIAGRPPPNDLEAEGAVLGACLIEPSLIGTVGVFLKPESFYSDGNGKIWGVMLEMVALGEPVGLSLVAAKLRERGLLAAVGGSAYLASLANDTPSVRDIEAVARVVWERWRTRAIIAECQMASAVGYGDLDGATPQEFAENVAQKIAQLAQNPSANRIEPIRDVLGPAIEAATRAAELGTGIIGRSTGFEKLDAKTAGLHDGDLTILAARPGMGKTSLMLGIAANCASPTEKVTGCGVAIFSLEMPKQQICTRMACTEGRIDLGKMRQGYMTEDDWRRLTGAGSYLSGLPIWIDDSSALTLLELRSKVRQVQLECERSGQRLGLVAVDYLQLMRASSRVPNREQEIGELSRGLKQVAKDFRVPVIALSQLNRSVETRGTNKRPQLSDLRESGSIEQDSDNVLFLYRDEYYNPEKTNAKGLAEIIIAKQRNGPTGKVLVRFSASCTRFDNLSPGDYPDMADDE